MSWRIICWQRLIISTLCRCWRLEYLRHEETEMYLVLSSAKEEQLLSPLRLRCGPAIAPPPCHLPIRTPPPSRPPGSRHWPAWIPMISAHWGWPRNLDQTTETEAALHHRGHKRGSRPVQTSRHEEILSWIVKTLLLYEFSSPRDPVTKIDEKNEDERFIRFVSRLTVPGSN